MSSMRLDRVRPGDVEGLAAAAGLGRDRERPAEPRLEREPRRPRRAVGEAAATSGATREAKRARRRRLGLARERPQRLERDGERGLDAAASRRARTGSRRARHGGAAHQLQMAEPGPAEELAARPDRARAPAQRRPRRARARPAFMAMKSMTIGPARLRSRICRAAARAAARLVAIAGAPPLSTSISVAAAVASMVRAPPPASGTRGASAASIAPRCPRPRTAARSRHGARARRQARGDGARARRAPRRRRRGRR